MKKPVHPYLYSSPNRFYLIKPVHTKPNPFPAGPTRHLSQSPIFVSFYFLHTPGLLSAPHLHTFYFISSLFISYAFYFRSILFRDISFFYLCFMHSKSSFALYFSLSLHFILLLNIIHISILCHLIFFFAQILECK